TTDEAVASLISISNSIGPGAEKMGFAELTRAITLLTNATEATAENITELLGRRFRVSVDEASKTMLTMAHAASDHGMSFEVYAGFVNELAMSTRAYSHDINMSRGFVEQFSDEL